MSESTGGLFGRLFRRRRKQEKTAEAPKTEAQESPSTPQQPHADEARQAEGTCAPETERLPDEDDSASASAEAAASPSGQEGEAVASSGEEEVHPDIAEAEPAVKAERAVAEAEETASAPAEDADTANRARKGWFSRLREGLAKSSSALGGGIAGIFTRRRLDEDTLQELEDILIQADLGIDMAERVIERLRRERFEKTVTPEEVKAVLAEEIARVLKPVEKPFEIDEETRPFVVLVVGVNGSGKTTTIGKLAALARREGHSVMLVAGDTFRAAAVEQLGVWAERAGAAFMKAETGADAAALAFDALKKAQAENVDIVFMDTAGRLQNRRELMDELAKIVRVMKKVIPEAPHAVLLVLDATVGQNALMQVEAFREVAGVTGLIMTKLDGTARGGILVAIAEKYGLPVHAIGVGEQIDDLQPFNAEAFARAIAGLDART